MSDRDREVVGEAGGAGADPPGGGGGEDAGLMLEWDWGSEQLAVAESCHPVSRKRGG